jgi:hypothetical protein
MSLRLSIFQSIIQCKIEIDIILETSSQAADQSTGASLMTTCWSIVLLRNNAPTIMSKGRHLLRRGGVIIDNGRPRGAAPLDERSD